MQTALAVPAAVAAETGNVGRTGAAVTSHRAAGPRVERVLLIDVIVVTLPAGGVGRQRRRHGARASYRSPWEKERG